MPAQQPLKISYCTTCKGRRHHLEQTLRANLEAERANANVEFVVLDYGSDDGLGAWIHANFMPEIEAGRLRYARTEQQYFEVAHAKNMAHRLATGDILCNLDADNTITANYSKWISHQFAKNPHSCIAVVSVDPHGRMKGKIEHGFKKIGLLPQRDGGTFGRIILHRDDFAALGGYDESLYRGHGPEDWDILHRAHHMGLRMVRSSHRVWGNAIEHSNEERWEHRHPEVQAMPTPIMRGIHPRPHLAQTGCGEVCINFDRRMSILPLKAGKWQPLVPAPANDNGDAHENLQGGRSVVSAVVAEGTLSAIVPESPLVTIP